MREYRFPFSEPGPFVRTLNWDLLASLDLLLIDAHSRSREHRYRAPDGVIREDGHTKEIIIALHDQDDPPLGSEPGCRILSAAEEATIRDLIEASSAVPLVWDGAELNNVAGRYFDSVGRVLLIDRRGDNRFASGFLYRERNLLVTAAHVVDPAYLELASVQFGEFSTSGAVIRLDREKDIGLVRLDEPAPGRPIAINRPVHTLKAGTRAVVIGHPNMPGLEPTPSIYELKIASVKRSYLMKTDLIELSTHLGGGFSGAPLLDEGHTLVGMVVAYPDSEGGDDVAIGKWPRWTPLAVGSDEIAKSVHDWLDWRAG